MTLRPLATVSASRLLKSLFVLKFCAIPGTVTFGSKFINLAKDSIVKRPLHFFVKHTFYQQFCGGETISEVREVVKQINAQHMGAILDYAAEAGAQDTVDPAQYERSLANIEQAGDLAFLYPTSRIALKLTSFFSYHSLKTLSDTIRSRDEILVKDLDEYLKDSELAQGWQRLILFLSKCVDRKIVSTIDAEHLETQPAIDLIALNLMRRFNTQSAVYIQNTYQMYLSCASSRLFTHLSSSSSKGFGFGVKLVRGAYLSSDRSKSLSSNYGPIFKSIELAHENYDYAITRLITEEMTVDRPKIDLTIASHNQESCMLALSLLDRKSPSNHSVSFAQLYGMQDTLAAEIVEKKQKNFRYLPFGPTLMTLPYLIRRAQENASMLRSSTDIAAIKSELRHRFLGK